MKTKQKVVWLTVVVGLVAGGVVAMIAMKRSSVSSPALVPLPAGAYVNARGERATVAPFSIARTETTVAEYGECVAAGKCAPAQASSPRCNTKYADRAAHPINCVSWDQASAYCAWRGLRLPSEDEWEWAARGASAERVQPFGAEAPDGRVCWQRTDGTCPVGSLPGGASPQGVADLAGGVWEWTDGTASPTSSMRVFRGGAWNSTRLDHLGARGRDRFIGHGRSDAVGFRCAGPSAR